MTEPTLMSSTLAQDDVILSPYFQDPAGHLVVLCSTNVDLTISKECVQCPGITEPTLMRSTLAKDDVILSPYFKDSHELQIGPGRYHTFPILTGLCRSYRSIMQYQQRPDYIQALCPKSWHDRTSSHEFHIGPGRCHTFSILPGPCWPSRSIMQYQRRPDYIQGMCPMPWHH